MSVRPGVPLPSSSTSISCCLLVACASATRTWRSCSATLPVQADFDGQLALVAWLKMMSLTAGAKGAALTTFTFGALPSFSAAALGSSVIMSTWPVETACTSASGLPMVWKITSSTFGGREKCCLLAPSRTNSPCLYSSSLNGPLPISVSFSNSTAAAPAACACHTCAGSTYWNTSWLSMFGMTAFRRITTVVSSGAVMLSMDAVYGFMYGYSAWALLRL